MSNYSDNPGSIKVDFYKPSGKWYMTEAWDMSAYYRHDPTAIDAVIAMLEDDERGRKLLSQFIIVVDEPYHKFTHPVMLIPMKMWNNNA